jgi:Xaa-Pro aminopeptidase
MSSKLTLIRRYLNELKIDAFIVGSGDAHQSEYVHESDMRRTFISEFTGSAGTALVLRDKALLWTDGRYFLQASIELSEDWTLMKSGEPGVSELNDWIKENMAVGSVVGVDPYLISASQAMQMEKSFADKSITLKPVMENPVDKVWVDRPALPCGPIRIHDISLAGKSHADKVNELKIEIENKHAIALVVSMLDDVSHTVAEYV